MGASFTELNTDFGELCDGVIDTVLEEYDQAVEGVSGASGVLSRKQAELKQYMLRELGKRYNSSKIYIYHVLNNIYIYRRTLIVVIFDVVCRGFYKYSREFPF